MLASLGTGSGAWSSTRTDVPQFRGLNPNRIFVVGGGLGVRYLNSDTAPTFEKWGAAIIERCRLGGISSRLLAEPGRCMGVGGVTYWSDTRCASSPSDRLRGRTLSERLGGATPRRRRGALTPMLGAAA